MKKEKPSVILGQLSDIAGVSQYRSPLMGFAILWIIVYHFYLVIQPIDQSVFPVRIGYGGVDIFLLLSGLGLYYSYTMGGVSLKRFYHKRLIRVLPAFWIVVVVYDIITHNIGIATLCRMSTLGLWLPFIPYSYWYISAILVFYLFFPLYMHFYVKYNEKCLIIAFVVGVVLTSLYTIMNHSDTYRNEVVFFLSRIPVFFTGVSFGRLSIENRRVSTKQMLLLAVGAIMAFVFLYYLYFIQYSYNRYFINNTALDNYPFIIIAPFICLFLPGLFHFSSLSIRIMSFWGGISLELYLIHLKVIYLFKDLLRADIAVESLCFLLIYIVVCVILAYGLNRLVSLILNRITNNIFQQEKSCKAN